MARGRDLVDRGATTARIGLWDHPLVDPNLEAGLGQGLLERQFKARFRLKSWQYMTAVTDELFVAFVVGTAGFASNGFVYAAELPGGRTHEKFVIAPLTLGTRISKSSATGSHRFAHQGLAIAIENLDGGRRFAARITAATAGGGRLEAELAFASAPTDQHLALSVPLSVPGGQGVGDGHWNYTHKYAGFAVTGHVDLDGRRVTFAPGRSFGAMDFTKMYAPRHSVWRWIALAGKTKLGKTIGLNLVDPTPEAAVSENALWIDGKRDAIAEVHLEVTQPGEPAGPWHLDAATIDVDMRPIAHVEQKLDLPVVRHQLRHIVGAFSGHVRTASGMIHDLDNLVGVAEDWDTWW